MMMMKESDDDDRINALIFKQTMKSETFRT